MCLPPLPFVSLPPPPPCLVWGPGKSRAAIQREVKEKNAAVEALVAKYTSATLSADDVRLCLASINDNNTFLVQNRDPVRAIRRLCHGLAIACSLLDRVLRLAPRCR
jgi:hypothetical protein